MHERDQQDSENKHVLSPYNSPYSKALGKDVILVCHDRAVMHCRAAVQADLFLQNYIDARKRSTR